jgi:hypothetical protein
MDSNEKPRGDRETDHDDAPTDDEARELDAAEIERMARQKHGDPIESARGFLFREH